MFLIFYAVMALAGGVIIDAEVPVELRVEGRPYLTLLYPAQARFEHPKGATELTLFVNGVPRKITVQIPETGHVRVVVGRNGVSHSTPDDDTPVAKDSTVVFRAIGLESVQLRIDGERHFVSPKQPLSVKLTTGRHPMEVRNNEGTLIWAKGILELSGRENVVVQMTEGRMPEVVGSGSQFLTKGP
jgi:hypothetical protein